MKDPFRVIDTNMDTPCVDQSLDIASKLIVLASVLICRWAEAGT
jgi:hypothetical protein